jgi:hypothetical protein
VQSPCGVATNLHELLWSPCGQSLSATKRPFIELVESPSPFWGIQKMESKMTYGLCQQTFWCISCHNFVENWKILNFNWQNKLGKKS